MLVGLNLIKEFLCFSDKKHLLVQNVVQHVRNDVWYSVPDVFEDLTPSLLTAFKHLFPQKVGVQILLLHDHLIQSNRRINCI